MDPVDRKKRKTIASVIRNTILIVFLLILAAGAGILGFATATEYRPAERESMTVTQKNAGNEAAAEEKEGAEAQTLHQGDTLRVLTWNAGYGALGSNADFFMDGGHMVYTADLQRVNENLEGIAGEIRSLDADLVLLQETDTDSARSRHIQEEELLREALPEYEYSSFAWNFKTPFVPYPLPPIGRVNSGLLTLSVYPVSEAERVQLPCPFSWPMRTVNLKRCVVINRIPLESTDHDLAVVNLHLEAYDSGEGKAAQTEMLRDLLQEELDAGNYVIAGGDFNQVFSGTDISACPVYEGKWQPGFIDESDFSEDWQFCMDSSAPTCRSLDQPYDGADRNTFQYYMIDGFIISSNIEVLSIQTQDMGFAFSDHDPVTAEIRLL